MANIRAVLAATPRKQAFYNGSVGSVPDSSRIVLRLEITENEIILHDVGSHDEVYR